MGESWMIEWWEVNPVTEEVEHNSDSWRKWEDVVRIIHDCMTDTLCEKAKVYYFSGEWTAPKLILEYCPECGVN